MFTTVSLFKLCAGRFFETVYLHILPSCSYQAYVLKLPDNRVNITISTVAGVSSMAWVDCCQCICLCFFTRSITLTAIKLVTKLDMEVKFDPPRVARCSGPQGQRSRLHEHKRQNQCRPVETLLAQVDLPNYNKYQHGYWQVPIQTWISILNVCVSSCIQHKMMLQCSEALRRSATVTAEASILAKLNRTKRSAFASRSRVGIPGQPCKNFPHIYCSLNSMQNSVAVKSE